MHTPEDVLDAASVIQFHLNDLLGLEAESVEPVLKDLLDRSESGEVFDKEILELLEKHEATREWMDQFLNGTMPPQVMRNYKRSSAYVSRIQATDLVCPVPHCNFCLPRPKAGIELYCKKHNKTLIPAQSKTQ